MLYTKEEILPALIEMEHRPWPEWRNYKPLTSKQLAGLLKPFGVSPRTVRRGDGTGKGYRRVDLEDAFARYAEASPFPSVTPSQAKDPAGFDGPQSVTRSENVTDQTPEKASVSVACDVVTDEQHPASEEEATWTA